MQTTETTYSYDDADRLIAVERAGQRTEYAYDANGNLISETHRSSGNDADRSQQAEPL